VNYLRASPEASVHKKNRCLLRKRFYTEAEPRGIKPLKD